MDQKIMQSAYVEWILSHRIEDSFFTETDDRIVIDTDFATAEVNFYEFESLVVELRITQKKNDEMVFFLHFELLDLEYAKDLFNEMIDTLEEIRQRKSVRVLLSCTSAFTTSLMAEKLNQASKLASDDFCFDATPYTDFFTKAPEYDMVLLAPQIAHEAETIKGILPNIPVVNIPAKLFATCDAPGILEDVKREYAKRTDKKKTAHLQKQAQVDNNKSDILVLAIMNEKKNRCRMICRHYRGGTVTRDEQIIRRKRHFLRDVCDILDTSLQRFERFDAIGITMPGAVHNGRKLDIPTCGGIWINPEVDIKAFLENKYHIPVILQNNTQSGVIGFQSQNRNYKNVAFYSQGFAARFGGVGIMINGQVVKGAHDIAGELAYVLSRVYGLTISESHNVNPEEMLETVEFNIRAVIAIVDPEIILVRNNMIAKIENLRKKLIKTIPQNNLPELQKISDDEALEYMLLGIMMLCLRDTSQQCWEMG